MSSSAHDSVSLVQVPSVTLCSSFVLLPSLYSRCCYLALFSYRYPASPAHNPPPEAKLEIMRFEWSYHRYHES